MEEDGLSDPNGSGHFREGGIGLVGELRQHEVVEGTRGIANGAEDTEGHWEEVTGGREVLADGVVLVLLTIEGGGVRSFAGLGDVLTRELVIVKSRCSSLAGWLGMPLGRVMSACQVGLP